MTYNLLNYRHSTSYCPFSQNNPLTKEGHLKTITDHVNPDIMVCVEIGGNSATNGDFILTNVLNTGSVNYWDKAAYTSNGSGSLVNMLYYNTNKLALHSQDYITKDLNNNTIIRVIDVYRLYYKDPLLNAQSDTVFFTVIVAHLKAGQTASDLADRTDAAAAVMHYIQYQAKDDNIILAGDLNIYKSQEAAYQQFTQNQNVSIRLYDPLNTPGNWSNNGSFAQLHTQSTRTSQTNGGCFSSGGLDDRLDHILISDEIRDNLDNMHYINNTYWAVGNDGLHFNESITDGTNNSVPAAVLNALYGLSDHLPVMAEFDVKKQTIGITERMLHPADIHFTNPVQDYLRVTVSQEQLENPQLFIYDVTGNLIEQHNLIGHGHKYGIELQTSHLPVGIYLLQVSTQNGDQAVVKMNKI